MNNNACSGAEKLNKKSFLSMIGFEKYQKIEGIVSLQEVEKQKVYEILQIFNGNKKKTSQYLQIELSTLNIKLNQWEKQDTQPGESKLYNSSRNFFESTANWNISSFNSKNREVCIEIKTKQGKVIVSKTIPSYLKK